MKELGNMITKILTYKPFTYLLATFMAIYLADLGHCQNKTLPKMFKFLFTNQTMRAFFLLSVLFICQYNFYLASILVIVVLSSALLYPKVDKLYIEGFEEEIDLDKEDESSDDSEELEKLEKEEFKYELDDFVDLDADIDPKQIKNEFKKITSKSQNSKNSKQIDKCIDILSKIDDDKDDDGFKDLLQKIGVQRNAYLKLIKNKKEDEKEEAKEHYHYLLKVIIKDFLTKLEENDEDYEYVYEDEDEE